VPTVAEVFVWLAYAIPMAIYVWAPARLPATERRTVAA
jgi:hypothetical protein